MSAAPVESVAWQAALLLEKASVAEACEQVWARLTFDPSMLPITLHQLKAEGMNSERKRFMREQLLEQVRLLIEAQELEVEILRAARLNTGVARGRLCAYRQIAAEIATHKHYEGTGDMKVTTIKKESQHAPPHVPRSLAG
jgi:hypothetical protein